MGDQKDAVNIGVTLSSQIIAASLTMLAIIGAFAAFIIDKREVNVSYYLIIGSSFFLFIASIILGGKGINKVREDGFNSTWTLTNTKKYFNMQAITALIGIILFASSIFLGKEKVDNTKTELNIQKNRIDQLVKSDSIKKIELNYLIFKFDSLKKSHFHALRNK